MIFEKNIRVGIRTFFFIPQFFTYFNPLSYSSWTAHKIIYYNTYTGTIRNNLLSMKNFWFCNVVFSIDISICTICYPCHKLDLFSGWYICILANIRTLVDRFSWHIFYFCHTLRLRSYLNWKKKFLLVTE